MAEKKHENHYDNAGIATKAIHYAQQAEKWDSRCVIPPIVLSTTFKLYDTSPYIYGRLGNPTREVLEKALAALENAKFGLCFSSGLGAITTASYLVNAGDHVMLSDDVYGGTSRFYNHYAPSHGLEVTNVDMTNLENVSKGLKENTKMLWFESPTNPLQKIIDIKALCETVRKTHPNVIIAIDNTFASPYFQNPLELGVDLVMHSVTKYLNGHADVILGALIMNNEEMYQKLYLLQYSIGSTPSPFDCYLVIRGLKTFAIRMEKHMQNALKIAKWLETNPRVEKVLYPFLPSHPQHEIAKKQMRGIGGMISFYVKGNEEDTLNFIKALKVIFTAVSLGGVESLIEHAATQTHADVEAEHRIALGITDNFLRFSVGIEDVDDLINDLDQALKATIMI